MTEPASDYTDYLGRTRSLRDTLTAAPLRAMRALLDLPPDAPAPGTALPCLWHWLYFLEPARQSQLGDDGHPRRGGFLPPIPLPRRMWAASALRFHAPLCVGQTLVRQSTIRSIDRKRGRTGELAFVVLAHQYRHGQSLLLEEEQTLVFRTPAQPESLHDDPPAAPAEADFSRVFTADGTLLFRYSALTFNAHRIHYDRDYARDEEHYPALVVHGPLLATLMLESLREAQPELQLRAFRFRALRPVFTQSPVTIAGRGTDTGQWRLWVADAGGGLCMEATATGEVSRR